MVCALSLLIWGPVSLNLRGRSRPWDAGSLLFFTYLYFLIFPLTCCHKWFVSKWCVTVFFWSDCPLCIHLHVNNLLPTVIACSACSGVCSDTVPSSGSCPWLTCLVLLFFSWLWLFLLASVSSLLFTPVKMIWLHPMCGLYICFCWDFSW